MSKYVDDFRFSRSFGAPKSFNIFILFHQYMAWPRPYQVYEAGTVLLWAVCKDTVYKYSQSVSIFWKSLRHLDPNCFWDNSALSWVRSVLGQKTLL